MFFSFDFSQANLFVAYFFLLNLVIKGKPVKEELNPPIDEGDLYSSDFRYWDVKRIYDVNVIEVFKVSSQTGHFRKGLHDDT